MMWAVEALNPTGGAAAAATGAVAAKVAAAALVRRNVIFGATVFTVGDFAAQLLTAAKKKKMQQQKITKIVPAETHQPYHPRGGGRAPLGGSLLPSDMYKISAAKNMRISGGIRETEKQLVPKQNLTSNVGNLGTNDFNIDMNRLLTSTFLGAVYSGFCVPFVYGNVERTFRHTVTKVIVTCSILSTVGNYVTMFARRFIAQYAEHAFHSQSSSLRIQWFKQPTESALLFVAILKSCIRSCNRDFKEVVIDDLKIWPIHDLACFSLIQPAWRPITTSIASSGWAMYMSLVSAKDSDDEHEQELGEETGKAAPISSVELLPQVAAVTKGTTSSLVAN